MARKSLARTFVSNLASEGSHVEARLDASQNEVIEIADESVDERGQDGEVVCGLEGGSEEWLVLRAWRPQARQRWRQAER